MEVVEVFDVRPRFAASQFEDEYFDFIQGRRSGHYEVVYGSLHYSPPTVDSMGPALRP